MKALHDNQTQLKGHPPPQGMFPETTNHPIHLLPQVPFPQFLISVKPKISVLFGNYPPTILSLIEDKTFVL